MGIVSIMQVISHKLDKLKYLREKVKWIFVDTLVGVIVVLDV